MTLTLTDLESLDAGGYAAANMGRISGTAREPLARLHEAELALYFGRPDEAWSLAEGFPLADAHLGRAGERGELSRRVYLIRADSAVYQRRFDEAERFALAVLEGAAVSGDRRSQARARIILASVHIRCGNYRLALECSRAAEAEALEGGHQFFRARAAYLTGYAHNHLGDSRAAETALAEASAILATCERGRYSAAAQNLLGVTLVDQGRPKDALPLFEAAEHAAVEFGLVDDALWYRVNAEHALYELGDYRGAVARFHSLALEERSHRHPAEGEALYWLALAACELRDRDRAVEAAREMLSLAEIQGTAVDLVDARLALARARGDAEAAIALIAEATAKATPRQLAEARLFAAEALAPVDPDRAARLLAEACECEVVERMLSLRRIAERVRLQTARAAVREEVGVLTIDTTIAWLTAEQAHDVMEAFIYREALRRSGGNQRAAAKLLDRAESDVHRKRKKYGL